MFILPLETVFNIFWNLVHLDTAASQDRKSRVIYNDVYILAKFHLYITLRLLLLIKYYHFCEVSYQIDGATEI